MTEQKAKFRYSAIEGVIELEGSESFISSHMETLTDLVRVVSRHAPIPTKSEKQTTLPLETEEGIDSSSTGNGSSQGGIGLHPKIYSQINEKLKIISKVPGSTKREKSINAALLYCYGAELMGDEQVPSSEIRNVCEEHGFLDSTNFSKIFDDNTTFLLDGKKGGNKQVKLTFNGREKAQALIKELEG